MGRSSNDDRSDRYNPNNDAYWAAEANEGRRQDDHWDGDEDLPAGPLRAGAVPDHPPMLPGGRPKAWLLGGDAQLILLDWQCARWDWPRYVSSSRPAIVRRFVALDIATRALLERGPDALGTAERATLICVLAWARGSVGWDEGIVGHSRVWPDAFDWPFVGSGDYPWVVSWLVRYLDDRRRSYGSLAARLGAPAYIARPRSVALDEIVAQVARDGLDGLDAAMQHCLGHRLLLGAAAS